MIFDSFFKTRLYDLCVVHFYRGINEEGRIHPFHRGILVVDPDSSSAQRGTFYHIALYGGRLWRFKRIENMDAAMDGDFAGSVKVGEIRKADLKLVEQILENVPITTDLGLETGGQEWTRDGIRRLAKGGFVDLGLLASLYKTLERLELEYVAGPRT